MVHPHPPLILPVLLICTADTPNALPWSCLQSSSGTWWRPVGNGCSGVDSPSAGGYGDFKLSWASTAFKILVNFNFFSFASSSFHVMLRSLEGLATLVNVGDNWLICDLRSLSSSKNYGTFSSRMVNFLLCLIIHPKSNELLNKCLQTKAVSKSHISCH